MTTSNAGDKRGAALHGDTGTNPLDRGARQTAHKGLRLRPLRAKALLRTVTGTGGREYGFRVALCYGASAAVAQALHHVHWYWLPATAVFLVKPDLGPLVSRVLNRAAGTVLGALVFAGFAAVLPRPEGLVALVAISGALIPVATRHFAAQTAVVTVLVLALVMVGGEPEASWSRIGETLLACAIVLIVGPPAGSGTARRGRDGPGSTAATDAAHAYLTHVLSGADDRAARWALRREAYRTAGRGPRRDRPCRRRTAHPGPAHGGHRRGRRHPRTPRRHHHRLRRPPRRHGPAHPAAHRTPRHPPRRTRGAARARRARGAPGHDLLSA